MSDNTEQRGFGYGSVLACAVGYTLFVLYASLVPLHYQSLGWYEAVVQFCNRLRRPISFEPWADFATNILFFVPLAFFWLGYAMRPGSRRRMLSLVIIVTGCCGILSTAIEFLQLWFPPRDSTLDDIVAETMGAAFGCSVWLLPGVTPLVAASIDAAIPRNKVQWLLFAYCVALACIALMPLDRTVAGSDLFRNFHEGKIAAVPFGYNYASAAGLACSVLRDVICFAPVGAYLAGCRLRPGTTPQPIWHPIFQGATFVIALELMQVILYDRVFSTTGLVSGSLGVVLGYLTMRWPLRGSHDSAARTPINSLAVMGLFLACVVASCFALQLLASR